MPARPRRLRTIVTVVTATVTAVSLFSTVCLLVLASFLHATIGTLAGSVESVRFSEETERVLVQHERAVERTARAEIEKDLRLKLAHARRFVSSEEQARTLDEAIASTERYLAAVHAGRPSAETSELRGAAYAVLEKTVQLEADEAWIALDTASRWERRAISIGVGLCSGLLALAGWLVWWLNTRALRPVFTLATSMERFAKGDQDARAPETGTAELREMVRGFNEMADALVAQRRRQLAFLGGVAHDLRNPLSVLAGSVWTLSPDRPLPPEVELRRVIARVSRQISSLERMLGDFMDAAKVDAGELELRLSAEDAREIVGQVLDLFEPLASNHRFDVKLPAEPVELRCDRLRLQQVLGNLVSNAVKYSPHGGSVEVAVSRTNDEVSFAVTDHGVGMTEHDIATAFQPFRRGGLSKESIPGVGLGLFVVRRIVDLHGGRVEAQSTLGRGSTFRVHLPIAPDVGSERESPHPATPAFPTRPNVQRGHAS